jgi:Protein of unknown function (DUF1214)
MAMRVTGIGSQYLIAMADADKNYFNGPKTYKATLPKGIPEANFWSFTVYDNQTRSMLDTHAMRGGAPIWNTGSRLRAHLWELIEPGLPSTGAA